MMPHWPLWTSAVAAHSVSEVMHLIGDVKGKVAVLVDDMIRHSGHHHQCWQGAAG